jgi:ketosteroid isomerase-like protein
VSAPALSPADAVQRLFRLRHEGRIEEVVELFAHRVDSVSLADGTRYRSRDEIRGYVQRELSGERRVEVTCTRLVEAGDRVLVEGRMRLLSRTGLADSPAVWVFRVSDGLITEVRPFTSLDAAHEHFPIFRDGEAGTPAAVVG